MTNGLSSIAAILIILGGVVPMTVLVTVAAVLQLQSHKDQIIERWNNPKSER